MLHARNNFSFNLSRKKMLQVARTIFMCNTPRAAEFFSFFKLHEKLNRFLLSATYFFKLHTKKTKRVTWVLQLVSPHSLSQPITAQHHNKLEPRF